MHDGSRVYFRSTAASSNKKVKTPKVNNSNCFIKIGLIIKNALRCLLDSKCNDKIFFSWTSLPNPQASTLVQVQHFTDRLQLVEPPEHICLTEPHQYKHTFSQHPNPLIMYHHNFIIHPVNNKTHQQTKIFLPSTPLLGIINQLAEESCNHHQSSQMQPQRLLRPVRVLSLLARSTTKEV